MTPQPQPEVPRDSGLLKIALRVLSAVAEWHTPDPGDIECLRDAVNAGDAGLPPDDLARLVVEREMARRRQG